MKIVWISHSQKLGGAERSLCEAVAGITACGHEVMVIVPLDGELSGPLQRAGAQVTVIPSRWWVHSKEEPFSVLLWMHKLVSHLRAAFKLCRFLQQVRPDVVVTNTLTVATGAAAAKVLGLPHVWYIHEFGWEDHGLRFDLGHYRSWRLINRWSDRIIVNSRAMLSHFQKRLSRSKVRLAYYSVEMPSLTGEEARQILLKDNVLHGESSHVPPVEDRRCQLLLMGQLVPGKRQGDAIQALAQLRSRSIDVQLTLIGSEHNAGYSIQLRRLVTELSMEDYVTFLPFTEHPARYLAASDIVLLCSAQEAFGRVTVEAMKLGKPVVGTERAGTLDLIEEGERGFLYPVGDVKTLAAKLEILCCDADLRQSMGRNAQDWALRTFNTDVYATELLSIFEEACSHHRTSRRRASSA